MQVFSPQRLGFHFTAVPHFVLIGVLLIGLFYSRSAAVWYGVIFGFMLDLIYTDILGVYAFCIALSAYLLSLLSRLFHLYIIIVFFIGLACVALLEFGVYGMYGLIGKASLDMMDFAKWRLIPTLILNGVFMIIIFYPMRRMLVAMKDRKLTV